MSLLERIVNKFHLGPTKTKIVLNVFWAVAGKVVTLLSTLVVGIFVARYLGGNSSRFFVKQQEDIGKVNRIYRRNDGRSKSCKSI